MKNRLTLCFFFWGVFGFAQENSIVFPKKDSIIQNINDVKSKMDKFNVFLNFQTSLDAHLNKSEATNLKWEGRMSRIEFRGNINEKLFYRMRFRLNKTSKITSLEGLSDAADMISAGYRFSENTFVNFGKMGQNWGGFEYELNPMNIYDYSDFVYNIEAFLLGAMFYHKHNDNHEFSLNINNIRSKNFEEMYGANTGIEPSKVPFGYVLTWNGKFLNDKIRTRWSLGYHQEAQNYGSIMMILGTKFYSPKFNFFIDYSQAWEQLDRLRYASVYTDMAGLALPSVFKDVRYRTIVSRIEYKASPKWVYSIQGMYETADVKGKLPTNIYNSEKKALGYALGIEWLPFSSENLNFF